MLKKIFEWLKINKKNKPKKNITIKGIDKNVAEGIIDGTFLYETISLSELKNFKKFICPLSESASKFNYPTDFCKEEKYMKREDTKGNIETTDISEEKICRHINIVLLNNLLDLISTNPKILEKKDKRHLILKNTNEKNNYLVHYENNCYIQIILRYISGNEKMIIKNLININKEKDVS